MGRINSNGVYYLFSILVALGVVSQVVAEGTVRNNVVVFMSDDLSPFYLDPDSPMRLPNLKSLASRGVEFTNAHTAFPVCGPSRMSLQAGRYAESTKLYSFERYAPEVEGMSTVSMYMAKVFGYQTLAFGKVYHEDHDRNSPYAHGMFQAGVWTQPQRGGGSHDMACRAKWFCQGKENKNGDFILSRQFVDWLKNYKSNDPFLAFVGFRKPHLDVSVPSSYLKELPTNSIDNPLFNQPPSLGRNGEVIPFTKSLQYFDCYFEIKKRKVGTKQAYPPQKFVTVPRLSTLFRSMRNHYFAAANMVDRYVGHIVSYIDSNPRFSDTTSFVFISDHGFAMGEKKMFCKNALFDQQTRVPFIVAPAKSFSDMERGVVRTEPVSLVDLFPTIVQLATGITLNRSAIVDSSGLPLDGESVLRQDRPTLSVYTFSQYPRCHGTSTKKNWECVIAAQKCKRLSNFIMGYTVRTKSSRFVQWQPFKDVITRCDKPNWPGLQQKTRKRMKLVNQIDPTLSGGDWSKPAVQKELFNDYSPEASFRWGDWEKTNVLVDNPSDTTNIIEALELSAAIQWRFNPNFSGQGAQQPCSGNGYVRLRNPSAWTSVDQEPQRSDVECECLHGWTGELCDIRL